jgi:tetratricopeptide (TPR) repeat protein
LHQWLQQTGQVVIAAVAGMGGVGKTELAIQYANCHRQTYQGGICWLQANNENPLKVGADVVALTRRYFPGFTFSDGLNLEEQVDFCWRRWPAAGQVLVVLDDVTDYKLVEPYLPEPPTAFRFKVLITTRLQLLGGSIQSLLLDVLKPKAAMDLLKSLVGRERLKQEPWVARRLCKWLGYLPLGLQLVGRYLEQEPDLKLEEMLTLLEAEKLRHESLVRDEDDPTWTLTYQYGVAAAFNLSWKRLNLNAQQLGYLLGLFALAPISWLLVESVATRLNIQSLQKARRALVQLHLLQRTGEGIYRLHQLIREFLREKLEESAQAKGLKQEFAKTLVNDIAPQSPELLSRANRKLVEKLTINRPHLPHLEEVAQNMVNELSEEELAKTYSGLIFSYLFQGLLESGETWGQKLLTTVQERYEETHPSVISSQLLLAKIYIWLGRYKQAKSYLDEYQELSQRLPDTDHRVQATALSLSVEAALAHAQGQYAKAESLSEQFRELIQSWQMNDNLVVRELAIENLNNLALTYQTQCLYNKAELLFKQALELSQSKSEDDNLSVAQSLDNLGNLYKAQNRYSEAETHYQQALELKKRLLGNDHLAVVVSLNNLGVLYEIQEHYGEAETHYQQALEISKRLCGDNHLAVVASLNSLGDLYEAQKRYSEAESRYKQALEIFKCLQIDNHPALASTLNNLGDLYKAQGRYSEAEPRYLQALELRKRLLGNDHPDVAFIVSDLAELYKAQGRYSEAEPLYLQALELRKRLLGDNHISMALSLGQLGLLYFDQGRYSEAEPHYLQALELKNRLQEQGYDHPDLAIILLKGLAALYNKMGRYSKAEPLLVQVLKLQQRLLGNDHPDVATILRELALAYYNQSRYSEAEPLYLQVLELRKRLLGNDHPDVASSLYDLGNCYSNLGRHSEAELMFLQAIEIGKRLLEGNQLDGIQKQSLLPIMAQSFSNTVALVLSYIAQNRHSEVEQLCLRSLELGQRLLEHEGTDPLCLPCVVFILNTLANLYWEQGRSSEAEPLYLQALELGEHLLGSNQLDEVQSQILLPIMAQSFANANTVALLSSYMNQNRHSEIEQLCLKSLKLGQHLLEHEVTYSLCVLPMTLYLTGLAVFYQGQERYSEAERHLKRALELSQRLLEENYPNKAKTEIIETLSVSCYNQDWHSEAEPLYGQVLELRKRLLGDNHPDVATSVHELAWIYHNRDCYSKAEPLYRQAVELKKRLLGNNHPDLAVSLNNLAKTYFYLGRYNEAQPLYLQALEICEQQFGADHPNTLKVRENIEFLNTALTQS